MVTSVVLSSLALAGVLPAARVATAAALEVGGDAHPLGRLLAPPPARSVVRAADGSVLAVLHGDQDRTVVPLSAVPMTVRDAVLAIEDARFYAHGALDPRGIARAAVTDVVSGHIRQGGSDLTQQYVKNVVTGDRRSLGRKLVEALDAIQLQRHLSKDQILAAYLNQVYFGDGVYGIAAAAEHYFSRPVGRLTLAQAAALAGTIANPGRFRPTAGPAAGLAATRSWTGWRRSASPARPGSRRPSASRCGPGCTVRRSTSPISSTTSPAPCWMTTPSTGPSARPGRRPAGGPCSRAACGLPPPCRPTTSTWPTRRSPAGWPAQASAARWSVSTRPPGRWWPWSAAATSPAPR